VEDWERDFAAYVDGRRVALRGTAYLDLFVAPDGTVLPTAAPAGPAVPSGHQVAVSQPPLGTWPSAPGGSVGTASVSPRDR
jgi:hypothetical protein